MHYNRHFSWYEGQGYLGPGVSGWRSCNALIFMSLLEEAAVCGTLGLRPALYRVIFLTGTPLKILSASR